MVATESVGDIMMEIPSHRRAQCAFDCGTTVDTKAANTYQFAHGWVRSRGATGGINQLALRTVEPRYACHVCIDKLTSGNNTNQGEMFAR